MQIDTRVRVSDAMRRAGVLLTALTAAASLATLVPAPLPGQASPGSIAATVRDSAGAGIAGAELTVVGTTTSGFTNDRGQLRLSPVDPGHVRLSVRRLGFRPATVDVTVGADGPTVTTVMLVAVAQRLDPILVRGTARAYGEPMAGFYDRRSHGFGYFITRQDIEHVQPLELTDMFRLIPGVRIVSTRIIRNAIRMRGETGCAPLVWVDGIPAGAGELDLDDFTPESIEGIEVYNGLAEVPIQFMPPMNIKACGVIVVWSKRGEPKERTPANPVSPAELADLVAALKVYTADEVDTPAHPDTTARAEPEYPPALFVAGASGLVTAEFVVDTTGHVEMDTFHAISTTDSAFTRSVRRALAVARYIPAVLHGRHVRQVVVQPFRFLVGDKARQGKGE